VVANSNIDRYRIMEQTRGVDLKYKDLYELSKNQNHPRIPLTGLEDVH
jgi:hypothetical protein